MERLQCIRRETAILKDVGNMEMWLAANMDNGLGRASLYVLNSIINIID